LLSITTIGFVIANIISTKSSVNQVGHDLVGTMQKSQIDIEDTVKNSQSLMIASNSVGDTIITGKNGEEASLGIFFLIFFLQQTLSTKEERLTNLKFFFFPLISLTLLDSQFESFVLLSPFAFVP